jgi:hypothetical protein
MFMLPQTESLVEDNTAFPLDLYAPLTGNPERIAIIQPRVARHELPWEKIRN